MIVYYTSLHDALPISTLIVRIRMFRSILPSRPRKPRDPVYAPRPVPSSSAMICMQRNLGTPVMVPPGNTARSTPIRSEEHTSELQSPVHIVFRRILV